MIRYRVWSLFLVFLHFKIYKFLFFYKQRSLRIPFPCSFWSDVSSFDFQSSSPTSIPPFMFRVPSQLSVESLCSLQVIIYIKLSFLWDNSVQHFGCTHWVKIFCRTIAISVFLKCTHSSVVNSCHCKSFFITSNSHSQLIMRNIVGRYVYLSY